jgi:hypothetical protein
MGNENSDAQNNEECSYCLEHWRLLHNRSNKAPTSCTVKEIPFSVVNFSRHDDSEQHCAPEPRTYARVMEGCSTLGRSLLPSTSGCA